MTIPKTVVKNIIRKIILGADHRTIVINLIDAELLQYVLEFFKQIVRAKLNNESVTIDWYKKEFLCADSLAKEDIAIHSGMNMKTISNIHKSSRKEVVLDASLEHYHTFYNAINDLTDQENVDVTLTLKMREVSVDLNINESLVVINTIAVKRSALRGGLWSTAGKQVEKPLMTTLCTLFQVPKKYFPQKGLPKPVREIDFYLVDDVGTLNRCEVKLMGKGNPESADVVYARDSRVLVANKLSATNKQQLNSEGILWVELQKEDDYKRFEDVLNTLCIPCQPFTRDLEKTLDEILAEIIPIEVESSVISEVGLEEQHQEYDSQLSLNVD